MHGIFINVKKFLFRNKKTLITQNLVFIITRKRKGYSMIYKISPIEWSEPDKKFKVTVITGPHEYNVQNVLSPVRAALENYIREIID